MSYELAPLKIECTQSDITSLYRRPVIIKSYGDLSRVMVFNTILPFSSWFWCLFCQIVVALKSQYDKSISRRARGVRESHRTPPRSYCLPPSSASCGVDVRGEMIDTILYLIDNSASLHCCPGCHTAD